MSLYEVYPSKRLLCLAKFVALIATMILVLGLSVFLVRV